MPITITPAASTYHATFTAPAGADARTAASVDAPIQSLADNAAWSHDRIAAGIALLQNVSDVAALRALTTHTDGSIAVLRAGGGGAAFLFDGASTRSDDSKLAIRPNDIGSGAAGRWLATYLPLLSANPTFTGSVGADNLTATTAINSAGSMSAAGNIFAGGDATCQKLYAGAGCEVTGATAQLKAGCAVTGGNLTCSLDGDVQGDFNVSGNTTLQNVTANGSANLAGGAVVAGGQLTGQMVLSGDGRVRRRMHVVSANTDLAFAVAAGAGVDHAADMVYVPAGVLTTTRSYKCKSTGAANGSELEICTDDPTNAIALFQDDGTTSLTVAAIRNASGYARGVRLAYAGTGWRVIASDRVPLGATPDVGVIRAGLAAFRDGDPAAAGEGTQAAELVSRALHGGAGRLWRTDRIGAGRFTDARPTGPALPRNGPTLALPGLALPSGPTAATSPALARLAALASAPRCPAGLAGLRPTAGARPQAHLSSARYAHLAAATSCPTLPLARAGGGGWFGIRRASREGYGQGQGKGTHHDPSTTDNSNSPPCRAEQRPCAKRKADDHTMSETIGKTPFVDTNLAAIAYCQANGLTVESEFFVTRLGRRPSGSESTIAAAFRQLRRAKETTDPVLAVAYLRGACAAIENAEHTLSTLKREVHFLLSLDAEAWVRIAGPTAVEGAANGQ